jgi:hypothetical protein
MKQEKPTPQEELIASIRQEQIERILRDTAGNVDKLPSWRRDLFTQLVMDQRQLDTSAN